MKKIYTLYLFFALFGSVIFLSNSSGRASIAGEDTTGSPLSSRTCASAGCHSGNSFNVNLSLQLLDSNGEVVDKYKAGVTYDVTLTNNASGNPDSYGFQMVSLVDANNSGANGWATTNNNAQTVDIGPITYVEQAGPDPSNAVRLKWTAPNTGTGNITFYAVGNAVNGNGSPGGDGVGTLALTLEEDMTSNTIEVDAEELNVFPNPASDQVQISLENVYNASYKIMSLQGQIMQTGTIVNGTKELNISSLSSGLYIIHIEATTDQKVYITKLIKE